MFRTVYCQRKSVSRNVPGIETFQVLKPGGHLSISDIVIINTPPTNLISDLELYVGCVAGAIKKEQYLNVVKEAGFANITVQNEKRISVPGNLLIGDSSNGDLEEFRSGRPEFTA